MALDQRPNGKHSATSDVNILEFAPLLRPTQAESEFPLSEKVKQTVLEGREEIRQAISGRDQRMVVVTGPCSIHELDSAMEYASRLAKLRLEVSSTMNLVMRVYFEKPRTTLGWKGLIYDPHLDESHDINEGLRRGRKILLAVNELGVPCATEFLDPIVPQYIADLVAWAAIGARTTESQTHRQMASGLSMPVGFKNATDGDLQVALDAMVSARGPHSFLGIDHNGQTTVVRTKGNPDVHMVLRGGSGSPNCSPAHIAFSKVLLEERNLSDRKKRHIMVDCSHGNSNKNFLKQPDVFNSVIQQRLRGEACILGLMLESHINEGRQDIGPNMKYGQSVTDGCIGWEASEKLIRKTHELLAE